MNSQKKQTQQESGTTYLSTRISRARSSTQVGAHLKNTKVTFVYVTDNDRAIDEYYLERIFKNSTVNETQNSV